MNKGNDALTLALIEGGAACGILENQTPTIKDLEEAVEHFGLARKALQAALVLIQQGVYTVAPMPTSGTPLPME